MQENYFPPFRSTLLENYAELLTLLFEPHEFYEPQHIQLRTMLFYRTQEKYLKGFRQRISNIMTEAIKNRQPINLLEAQRIVWQQLEEELLQLSVQTEQ